MEHAVKLVAGVAGAWQAHVVLDRFGSGPQSSQPAYDARVASTNAQNSLMAVVHLQRALKNWFAPSAPSSRRSRRARPT